MDLKDKGVLEPYKGPGYQSMPAEFKDPDGCWAGFAARMRVYIINTDKMPATPEAIEKVLASKDRSRFAIAKPLYGTTLTHYCVLWKLWGQDVLQTWHRDCRKRGLVEATGNAHVKDLVAQGVCDLGWTDSDDFFVAKDQGAPVGAVPVKVSGKAIVIPNTVSIIKGTRRPKEAQEFVDYLLSGECEVALANSSSRQIPLGPVDETALPIEVREFKKLARSAVPLTSLGPARTACLAWLKQEYLR